MKADHKPRGEMNLRAASGEYDASRWLPADDLAFFIIYYWFVRWDRTGEQPYDQEVLTHPCLHIVFEADHLTGATTSRVVGLMRKRFTRRLEGKGQVVGVAFHPGALFPWLGFPASRLTDKMVPLGSIFELNARAIETSILAPDTAEARVEQLERFLRAHRPARDTNVSMVKSIVERIGTDAEIAKVEDLVPLFGLGKRALQRLFNQYVGVGPKWVIRRFRLIEAARQLETDGARSLADLAGSLGYFDQAHFIKDFKSIVGRTPTDYARLAGPTPSAGRGRR